ncbi:hypothetical protein FYC62_08625 [Pedobacter aquae]|uniref:Glycoside hydrolase family 5 domain-containing protein n=1 Tax=Pedobacter aquae TaxID=2605747 RepID=A0A5C0VI01_9SPHI|nr:hypothetical protein [Pedobacter aquae]QEK51717.1 hypothetical protein FYC62_08625 [Pedobacter aquae]
MRCLLFFLYIFFGGHLFAQSVYPKKIKISNYLFGQNAWERSGIFKVQEFVKDVQYQTIRIGGNGYENAGFINKEAIKLIDYVRSVGAEPILQMPRQFKNNDLAFKAITYINGENKKGVKFWSIGNEPDHKNQFAKPEEVYDYFTKISEQIKRYDANVKIIGFDAASFTPDYHNRLLGGDLDLTGKISGKDYYYLDVVSFHHYKFKDISRFETDVKDLKQKLYVLNKNRAKKHHLTWAITEFNSHWLVDKKLEEDYQPYTFYNGQMFAELYDLGMREQAFTICPWSILEGGADREGTDLSMFDFLNNQYLKRSNYYHTWLLSRYKRAYYLPHQESQKEIVVIPMGDKEGMTVMLLNKSKQKAFEYHLQFNRKKTNKHVSINIAAGLAKNYQSAISPQTTHMLVFDKRGNLLKNSVTLL